MQLLIPAFSMDEILELRELAFADKPGCSDVKAVLERFDKWGGTPRNVLTMANNVFWRDSLEFTPSGLSLPMLVQALSHSTALNGVASERNSHRHIKLVPRGALPNCTLTPADQLFYLFDHAELISPYVEHMYAEQLLAREAAELYTFLHQSDTDPAIASFRGKLYEHVVALPRLSRGRQAFSLARLSAHTSLRSHSLLQGSELDLRGGLRVVHFRSIAELARDWAESDDDAMFVPPSKVYPAVDCVLRVRGVAMLANATVSESHGIKVANDALNELLDAIGLESGDAEIPFLWILPAGAYEGFSEPGPLKGAGDKDLVSGASSRHNTGKRIAQFKVLVEVPTAVSRKGAAA